MTVITFTAPPGICLEQVGWVVVRPKKRKPVPFTLKPSADKFAAGVRGVVKPCYRIVEAPDAE